MKKVFKSYVLIWAIFFAVFNVICFVIPSELWGYNKFGGAFWTAYIFVTIAFAGQLACAYLAFKAENLQTLFYNIPIIRVSYIGLIVTMIIGSACMAIPDLPNWVGIIVCVLVLAFTANAVIKSTTAATVVSTIDEKVKLKTDFIKSLTVEAESLMAQAETEDAKAACKKVYEALRYSNPVSSNDVEDIETEIFNEFKIFAKGVSGNYQETESGSKLLALISERNVICKSSNCR